MAIQNLSFAELLASANRAASSPVLNMGPPSPTTQTVRITPSTSQGLTLAPSFTAPAETITLPTTPINQIPFEELIQATDAALYYAKRTGKNHTCLASEVALSEVTRVETYISWN